MLIAGVACVAVMLTYLYVLLADMETKVLRLIQLLNLNCVELLGSFKFPHSNAQVALEIQESARAACYKQGEKALISGQERLIDPQWQTIDKLPRAMPFVGIHMNCWIYVLNCSGSPAAGRSTNPLDHKIASDAAFQ